MNILLTPGVYLPHQRAGSEIYLHRVVKYLQTKGHAIKAVTRCPEPYKFEEIEIFRAKDDWKTCNNNLWDWADLVFCQLSGTGYAMNKSRQMDKKVISFAHNNAGYPQIGVRSNVFPVYNCENTKKELGYQKESFTLPPPVDYRDYTPTINGQYVTLINHNENKGGRILIEIAKRMPDVKFMAVHGGYYEQIKDDSVRNIKYVPLVDDVRVYLEQTKLLIAPSEYESYGQAQVEAMCCGIPVIASDIAGFRESLGWAGVYVKRNDIDAWVETIRNHTITNTLKRAKELDPIKNLWNFNNWLEKINNLVI